MPTTTTFIPFDNSARDSDESSAIYSDEDEEGDVNKYSTEEDDE